MIYTGDCIEVMAGMEAESVDAIVTDPPYGLEFMGKEWDKLDAGLPQENVWKGRRGMGGSKVGTDDSKPGSRHHVSYGGRPSAFKRCSTCGKRAFSGSPCVCAEPTWEIEYPEGAPSSSIRMGRWHEAWAREAFRVAKPGAHLLAFGGTRTYHRLASAIEDAGWEIRDCLVWAYACLSDDTEILTDRGWVRYNSASEAHHAAAFDTATGELRWEPIEAVHQYHHEGAMARVGPSLTTLNHRVVLSPESQVPLPSNAELHHLWERVPNVGPLPGRTSEGVFAAVPVGAAVRSSFQEAAGRAQRANGELRGVRQGVLAPRRMASSEAARDHVLAGVQRSASPAGPALQDRYASGLDRSEQGVVSREDDRPRQPGLEGRRYRVQEAWELLWRALRSGSRVGAADGAQGRVRDGAPATDGRPVRLPADQDRMREPRESRPDRQSPREPEPVAGQPDSQALRVGQGDRGDGLSADAPSLVDYAGVVWCITVPSGAFVARRGGIAFVTGNSGFPKSLDVGKAMDRAAGAERTEVIGSRGLARWKDGAPAGVAVKDDGGLRQSFEKVDQRTAPATDLARKWEGWGTALKPAWEPVVMARKPLRGTVAGNVTQYGTGALNIGATRIPSGGERAGWADSTGSGPRYTGTTYNNGKPGDFDNEPVEPHPAGRWPANVILTDAVFEAGVEGVVGGSLGSTMTAWSSSPDSEQSATDSPVSNAVGRSSRIAPADNSHGSATAPAATQLGAWDALTDIPKPDIGCSSGTTVDGSGTNGSTAGSGKKRTDLSPQVSSSTIATGMDSTTGSTTSSSSPEPSTTDTIRPSHPASSEPDVAREPETLDASSVASESWKPSSLPVEQASYSRFFLIPKSSRADREPVVRGQLEERQVIASVHGGMGDAKNPNHPRANSHPTVKPVELMRHLVRLVTPPGGTVLDPFLGSGTTAIAAEQEGFAWIGIEKEPEYVAIAEARLHGTQRGLGLDVGAPTRKRSKSGQQGPTPVTNGQARWTEWREVSEKER